MLPGPERDRGARGAPRTTTDLKVDPRRRDHRVEPRRARRAGRRRRPLRLEAVRPRRAQHRRRGAARMTLARRMWLASAALALLVGAAFTALILAVSAQREATDREARSKDVTAASLQLEKARVRRRVELPQLRLRRERELARGVPRRERQAGRAQLARSRRPSSRTIRARAAKAQEIENADPGVRVRLRSRRWSRSCEEIPGHRQERPHVDAERQARRPTRSGGSSRASARRRTRSPPRRPATQTNAPTSPCSSARSRSGRRWR